jgi:hypothetical protein
MAFTLVMPSALRISEFLASKLQYCLHNIVTMFTEILIHWFTLHSKFFVQNTQDVMYYYFKLKLW